MKALFDIATLVRAPDTYLETHLAEPPGPKALFVGLVTPLAALRPIAVLLSSLFAGKPVVGVVLAIGSFVLEIGTWLALGLVFPTLARQVGAQIDERRAFAVTSFALVPSWLAGLLYLVPEDATVAFFWSRVLVTLGSLAGLYVAHRATVVLDLEPRSRLPLIAGLGLAGLTIYFLLFLVMGVSSHVVLFILGTVRG